MISPKRECGRLLIACILSLLLSHGYPQVIYDSIARPQLTGTPAQAISQVNTVTRIFSKAPDNYVNFGIAGNDYKYFLLKISAPKVITNQFLSIDNTSLDAIDIYKIDSNRKARLLLHEGYMVPYDTRRNYVWHVAQLDISPTPTLYLVALRCSNKNINIRYDILSGQALDAKYQAHDRIIFFYIGAVAIIILVVLFAIFLSRESVFANYLGYIICISVWIIAHYGYMFPYVYPRLPVLNEVVKPLGCLGSAWYLVALLTQVFKNALITTPWLSQLLSGMKRIIPVVAAAMLLLMIHSLPAFLQAGLIVIWHIALLFAICFVVFTPLYFINSGTVAKIFSIAMLVICQVALLQLFGNSGYINNYFLNEHGMTIGCLLENFILAFGLFYNFLLENSEKKKRLIELEREQAETLKKLINVQDDERKRIANDLHDNIGPLLAAIKINFQRLIPNIDGSPNGLGRKTEGIIDDSISEIRNVAHNLMPKGLTSKGLIIALKEYFENTETAYNKKIIFNHEVASIPSADIQANIYRIVCELVLNASKHSEATELQIFVGSDDKAITISIKDNGKGFSLKSAEFKTSFGLQSAESRVNYMHGTFKLKTAPGRGTLIDMQIPLQPH